MPQRQRTLCVDKLERVGAAATRCTSTCQALRKQSISARHDRRAAAVRKKMCDSRSHTVARLRVTLWEKVIKNKIKIVDLIW